MHEYEDRSSDPTLAMKLRFVGAAVGAGGLVYFVALIVHLAPGFFLSSREPVADAVDVQHNRWFGTEYAIRVHRGTYWCSGGDGQGREGRRGHGTPGPYVATDLGASVLFKNSWAFPYDRLTAETLPSGELLAATDSTEPPFANPVATA